MFFPCRSSILTTTIPPSCTSALTTLLCNAISPKSPISSLGSSKDSSLSCSPALTPATASFILLTRSSISSTVCFFHSRTLLPDCSAHFFATRSALAITSSPSTTSSPSSSNSAPSYSPPVSTISLPNTSPSRYVITASAIAAPSTLKLSPLVPYFPLRLHTLASQYWLTIQLHPRAFPLTAATTGISDPTINPFNSSIFSSLISPGRNSSSHPLNTTAP